MPKIAHFAKTIANCPTVHNGNNMVSVHEWIQPTQETIKKPTSEWAITSAMELRGGDQALKPQQKFQERPVLPKSLCDDPQWQQLDFSA